MAGCELEQTIQSLLSLEHHPIVTPASELPTEGYLARQDVAHGHKLFSDGISTHLALVLATALCGSELGAELGAKI